MAENSKIEWTDHTLNLWQGCVAVHEGCDHCYAEALSHRWGHDLWGHDKNRMFIKSAKGDIARFQKMAEAEGVVRRVFLGSMMDIFEKSFSLVDSKRQPLTAEWWARAEPGNTPLTTGFIRQFFFEITVPKLTWLDLLLLTKRPSNINRQIPEAWKDEPPANVMFGCSVVSPGTLFLADQLRQVNGRRFLSIEPQLEAIKTINLSGIDWVICGGESGPKRRPFNTDWGRYLRDECDRQNVPFFFKQVDKVLPIPDDLLIRQFPNR